MSAVDNASSPGIFTPARFPCGRVMRNRLVKAAMYEHCAALLGGLPNSHHISLYSQWARHGWGMLITGNVQVSTTHLSLGRDIIIPPQITPRVVHAFRALAESMHGGVGLGRDDRPLAIMQLSHTGRQSPNVLGGRRPFSSPLAPSSVSLGSHSRDALSEYLFHRLLFQTPREMLLSDIDTVVCDFTRGAELAVRAGFDGVQLHLAHGYLLSQFLSQENNTRSDEYGPTSMYIIQRIVSSIRAIAPDDFVLGVKVNASDYTESVESSSALRHVRELAAWRTVDFIEISGGDYERPDFVADIAHMPTSPRQALFAHFSHHAVKEIQACLPSHASVPLVILTGGLRTPHLLRAALAAHHADLLGVARGAVLCPDLPTRMKAWEQGLVADVDIDTPFAPEPVFNSALSSMLPRVRLVGAGVKMAWYIVAMRGLAREGNSSSGGSEGVDGSFGESSSISVRMGGVEAVIRMWLWVASREKGSFGPGPENAGTGTGFRLQMFVLVIGILPWVCWLELCG